MCKIGPAQYNFEINNEIVDVTPFIFEATRFSSQIKWFRHQLVSWNGRYSPTFAELRTHRGMGFSFNMIDAGKLLDLDE
jgi:hypothetical protein